MWETTQTFNSKSKTSREPRNCVKIRIRKRLKIVDRWSTLLMHKNKTRTCAATNFSKLLELRIRSIQRLHLKSSSTKSTRTCSRKMSRSLTLWMKLRRICEAYYLRTASAVDLAIKRLQLITIWRAFTILRFIRLCRESFRKCCLKRNSLYNYSINLYSALKFKKRSFSMWFQKFILLRISLRLKWRIRNLLWADRCSYWRDLHLWNWWSRRLTYIWWKV